MSFVRAPVFLMLVSASLGAQTPFQLHGYVQGRFTDQEGTPDRLEIRRARLLVSGEPVSGLSYIFQVDFAKRPYLMDVALTWRPSRALRFTAGQFKIPFSAESLISDQLNTPIARARAVNSLAPGRDTGVQGRDTGVQVAGTIEKGRLPAVDYAAGVFRGQTLVYAPPVHYQAVAGRVLFHPLHELVVGGDWYGSFSAAPDGSKRRWEGEGGYVHGPLQLRAEQIWARDNALERRGGYALASWRISPLWEPLARVDWYTANAQKANSTSVVYLSGLNFFAGKHLKVGANAGAQHDQGRSGVASVFLAQVMLLF